MAGSGTPYGAWTSPVTPASLAEASVGLSDVEVIDGRLWWCELRPQEGGRQVLVSSDLDGGGAVDELAPPHSARTQAHEYGGRCFAGRQGLVVFSEWADQRLWVRPAGGAPVPLTAEPPAPRSVRFAEPQITADGRWVVCVRETHGEDVVNDLVAVPVEPAPAGTATPVVLAAGHDFYSAPRLSPDGRRLAWLTWDHPDMPWDSTELWEAPVAGATLGDRRRVAGGPGQSVSQPRYGPDGTLHYVSDRTGWWNLYADDGAGGRPLATVDAEFAEPDWVFGQSSYAFLPDGTLVATWSTEAGARLGAVTAGGLEPAAVPYTAFSSVTAAGDGVVAIAGSPTEYAAVVRFERGGAVRVVRRSREATLDAAWYSVPRLVTFPSGGEEAHAWFYPPTNPETAGPPGERPPLVVMIHGGPTSAASSVLRPSVQFWTTRGFAVADVDYRGSTGYGRPYRDRLRQSWGVCDVEDCASVVAHLAGGGLVDGRRAVIRGGSAGGFTTLAALAFTDAFAAGASHYGVPDLELLARDTHKFESRYLDGLIGPWPEAAAVYRARSPINHLDRLGRPVLILQGDEDAVVPRAQADLIFEGLRDRGVPVAYLLFEGEQHGFRRADSIEAAATAELAFFGRVLGIAPAGEPALPVIANAERLGEPGA